MEHIHIYLNNFISRKTRRNTKALNSDESSNNLHLLKSPWQRVCEITSFAARTFCPNMETELC